MNNRRKQCYKTTIRLKTWQISQKKHQPAIISLCNAEHLIIGFTMAKAKSPEDEPVTKPTTAPTAAKPPASVKAKKRKAQDDGGARKKRKSKYEEDEDLLDLQTGVNKAFTLMDSQLLADHITKKMTKFGTDLSTVELSDLHISANAVKDTTSWQKTRTLANLPDFLESFVKDPKELGEAPSKKGAPHTIIVTGAGLRAADIVR